MVMFKVLIVLFLFMPINAFAEDRAALRSQAVTYSAQADAYNSLCESKTKFADNFISKFSENDELSEQGAADLKILRDKHYQVTLDRIEKKGIDCSALEYMLLRLQVMRKLKDVSYRLNGVDPSTLPPDNIPDIEGLLPPTSSQDELPNIPEVKGL